MTTRTVHNPRGYLWIMQYVNRKKIVNVCKLERNKISNFMLERSCFESFCVAKWHHSREAKRWHHHQVYLKVPEEIFSCFKLFQLFSTTVDVYLDLKLHGIHFQKLLYVCVMWRRVSSVPLINLTLLSTRVISEMFMMLQKKIVSEKIASSSSSSASLRLYRYMKRGGVIVVKFFEIKFLITLITYWITEEDDDSGIPREILAYRKLLYCWDRWDNFNFSVDSLSNSSIRSNLKFKFGCNPTLRKFSLINYEF